MNYLYHTKHATTREFFLKLPAVVANNNEISSVKVELRLRNVVLVHIAINTTENLQTYLYKKYLYGACVQCCDRRQKMW